MRPLSLARQLLLLQLVVVAVAVAVVGGVSFWTARDRTDDQQRERARSVAEALAASADVRDAIERGDPPARLQPIAEAARRRGGLGFVVFMDPRGIRWSHPTPSNIGKPYVGAISRAQLGETFTERRTGTLGPSVRAVAPIRDGSRIIGLVSVGVLEEAIADQVADQLPGLVLSLVVALGLGAGLSLLIARRVRRQTHGMDPKELATVHAHHDAVLHAIKEGVVVVGDDGRLRLANAEARRMLELPADAVGRPVAELVGAELAAALRGEAEGDVHVAGGRVLVGGRRRSDRAGTVTTLRDRTELEGLLHELDTVRSLADALRAQAHEAANELHTVVGLVELGRHEDAVAFATRRIDVNADEVALVEERLGDPALAALVLAKMAEGREKGVHLELGATSSLTAGTVPSEALITIVGNLVDNGFEAGARHVVLTVTDDRVEVRDDGPGIPEASLEHVFEPGVSTKGSGLGLALVAATAQRMGGRAWAANDGGAVLVVETGA